MCPVVHRQARSSARLLLRREPILPGSPRLTRKNDRESTVSEQDYCDRPPRQRKQRRRSDQSADDSMTNGPSATTRPRTRTAGRTITTAGQLPEAPGAATPDLSTVDYSSVLAAHGAQDAVLRV